MKGHRLFEHFTHGLQVLTLVGIALLYGFQNWFRVDVDMMRIQQKERTKSATWYGRKW